MKKYDKILSVIMLCTSVFMFINYVSYLFKLLIWSEGILPYIVSFFVCTLLPLVLFLDRRGYLRKLFSKAYIFVKTVYVFALTFYTVTFLLLAGYIYSVSYEATPPSSLPEKTVVVTLGAKVNPSGEPGKILRKRLEVTYDILSENEELICIVSGGKGSDEPISEALCMKNYLTAKGIDEDRIIVEQASTDTIENIKNTLALLEREGLSDYGIAFVTTNYHLPRVKILASDLGITDAYFYSAPDTGKAKLYTNIVREYMSYCKLFLLGT